MLRSRSRAGARVRPALMVGLAAAAVGLGAGTGCAPGAPAARPAPAAQPLAGLDAYIADAVRDWGIAGLSVAVVKDDAVVFARGYGVRDAVDGGAVDEHTLFAIGSNTKLFTAVAAGLMVDEGRMAWDDPATRHLPGFRLHDPYVSREITIRDLLSHRSGLGRRGDMLWYGSEYDRAEVLRRIRHLEPNSSFRSQYGYQNVMFLAAGEATAAAAGMSWDELVTRRIFAPLGMRRSNTSTHDLAGAPNVASPHIRQDGRLVPVPWRNLDNVAPAGSINSSAAEMAEWLRALLAQGSYGGDTLISASALRQILTPHTLIPAPRDTLFPSVHFLAYGLGIVSQDYRGRELFWHTGGIDGMLSLVAFVPEERLGLVVLTNTTGGNDIYTALMYDVVDRYLGGGTTDWSAALLRRTRESAERAADARRRMEETRVTGTRPSLDLGAYAGTYEHPVYGTATVTLEEGRLVLRRGPAFTGDLEHWHYDTFRAAWRGAGVGTALVTFSLDFRGRVAAMEVENMDTFRRARDGAAAGYGPAIEAVRSFIDAEMRTKSLPALSIALVDGQRIVWAEGFGEARPEDGMAASESTVYRVGSVSKLFTDIAVMQLVERGELDLDAPVRTYLPEFRPENPFGTEITLRQLMSHRSGLVREPPVGNYFEDDAPSLEATVRSLNDTRLVYAPETRTKYSNAGIAVVGRVLERTQGEPFARYLERTVLRPLGMAESSFEPRPDLTQRLAAATMWTYDHRVFPAPTFELGMAPAGSMYSTVTDLGRFLQALFAGGRGQGGQVLRPETLEAMWTPQYAAPGQAAGFGIGFGIGELDGRRRIGHNGAIYGFATELAALPDEELGVVVVTSRDMSNAVTERIADVALRQALAAREGRPLPRIETTSPVPAAVAARLAGRYRHDGRHVDLLVRGDTLFMTAGAVRVALRARGDTLVVDDPIAYGQRVLPLPDALVVGRDTLRRAPVRRPEPAPERWHGLIGEYGWDHNVLYILEKDGRLHALIEWFFSYPLEEVDRNTFRFPDAGLYAGEELVFRRDASGRATEVVAAAVRFPRREVGTAAGETFRITPVRPVDELRRDALAAEPPRETGRFREPELVEPVRLDPTIRLDVRYASTNNFMSAVFYDEPRVFLQRPAAEAVVRAHQRLREHGYGLVLHDGYRPWYVTKMFWDATPESMKIFVANPANGSRHNRGAAIDLNMFDRATGEPVQMVGGYDEFSDRSYPDYPGGTSLQRWRRDLLRDVMEDEGFDVYEAEWWHFDFRAWRDYPILNLRFDEIDRRAGRR